MNDFLNYLYSYAMEHLYLSEEYRLNRRCAERHLQQLEGALTPEQLRHFEVYQDSVALSDTEQSQTLFLAALKMGLYLGSLHHP